MWIAPHACVAVKSMPLNLRRQMTCEQVFQAIVGNCMVQIQSNAAALAQAYHEECLHQMRVGLRRLRSALSGFKNMLSVPDNLQQELDWLSTKLGAARDWDVLVGTTLPAAGYGLPDENPLVAVLLASRVMSDQAHAAVSAAVRSQRYTRLMMGFTRWVHESAWREAMLPLDLACLAAPGAGHAHKHLVRLQRRLLKRGGKLRAAGPEARHRFRITAKKLRYASGFYQSFCLSKYYQSYVKALSTLQDLLGQLNDAAVADRLLRDLQDGQPHLRVSAEIISERISSNTCGVAVKIRKILKKFAGMKLLE